MRDPTVAFRLGAMTASLGYASAFWLLQPNSPITVCLLTAAIYGTTALWRYARPE